MDLMRYTVVDHQGAVSFLSTPTVLPALVAACATDPSDLDGFLAAADAHGARIGEYVRSGLAIFDEHNLPTRFEAIHKALDLCPADQVPVFRVLDDRTRQTSLTPIRAGAVLFNLTAKRIVQIQNTAMTIDRIGRFKIDDPVASETRIVRYKLPKAWQLVP